MKIFKYTKEDLNKDIIKKFKCEECRKNIETEDFFILYFAMNKNNGKSLILCEDCTKKLQTNLNTIIK